MHYFEYASADATLYEGPVTQSQNTGLDEILEIRKDTNNNASVINVSRALIKFDLTYISQSVSSGLITSGSDTKFYLNLYDANSSNLTTSQSLYGYPVSQSWTAGEGKFYDNPKDTEGVSWRYRVGQTDGTQWISGSNDTGGTWYSGSGIESATATITITDYTELNAGDKVNLIAADGTNYNFTNGDQSSVNGTWESATSNNQTATNLMNVINTSSGPAGTRFTATVDSAVVTATQATAGTVGNTSVTLTDSDTAGMTKTNFSGGTWSESGYIASQSFAWETTDMRMDVTDVMWTWIDGRVPNEGFMIKRSGSVGNADDNVEEGNTTKYGHFAFFSRETNTIYQPKLEVLWNDYSFNSGSLSPLVSSDLDDLVVYMKGLRTDYKENSKVKFRLVGRERYPTKTYSTSTVSDSVTVKYLPTASCYYQIKDAFTEDVMVPYGSGSYISCDSSGNYFNFWMNGLQAERFYQIEYKVVSGSGVSQTVNYYGGDFKFKVSR
jgi:hypothetical protein